MGKKLKKKCCRSKPQCKRCPVPFLLKERDKARKKAAKKAEKAQKEKAKTERAEKSDKRELKVLPAAS